jgi:hypothetical protein
VKPQHTSIAAAECCLGRVVEEARAAVQQVDVVNVDETDWRRERQRA